MAAAGFLSAWANNPEATGCSKIATGIVSAAIALPLSHIEIFYPLYNKRKKIKNDCDGIIKDTFSHIDVEQTGQYKELISEIYDMSLQRATATWLLRRAKLTELRDTLLNKSDHRSNPDCIGPEVSSPRRT